MCESAVIRLRGREDQFADNMGEVARALNVHVSSLPLRSGYERAPHLPSYKSCLCPLDFRALGARLGMKVMKHSYSASLTHGPRYEGLWEMRANST